MRATDDPRVLFVVRNAPRESFWCGRTREMCTVCTSRRVRTGTVQLDAPSKMRHRTVSQRTAYYDSPEPLEGADAEEDVELQEARCYRGRSHHLLLEVNGFRIHSTNQIPASVVDDLNPFRPVTPDQERPLHAKIAGFSASCNLREGGVN